ncbi:unnamed protein product [Paramecium primaurelia]|uniref:Uncharacterized protein n=1 Tax=Paramecium primaurelia TaxID=5886 RepID=A0A8S1LNZ2_PARPR|nr:unnamed protein product [Paramecium primaurelia]
MNKNQSLSYTILRKKSALQTSDTTKITQQQSLNKSRAKSITSTTIKKPITIIKPPQINLNKIDVSPFTFANRLSHDGSTDQTNSASLNSDQEQQRTIIPQKNNQEQLQILKRQKQILEYRLRQETESCQQYQQNYHNLQELLQKLEHAKSNYINEMNSFTQCLRLVLNNTD